VFGAAARGELRPESDIDFMVEFEAGARIGLLKFMSLSDELEAAVGRKVDLVTKRGLKPWSPRPDSPAGPQVPTGRRPLTANGTTSAPHL
jgi:predicted nucleotidyltransferase